MIQESYQSQTGSFKKTARFKDVARLNYSVDEASHAAHLGRSTLYEAIAAGELETLKVGKRRLVPVAALERWLAGKTDACTVAGMKRTAPADARGR